MRLVNFLLAAILAMGAGSLRADDTAKSDEAADKKPSTKISEDAKPLVDQISQAYSKLKSLELAGTISDDVVIDGSTTGKHAVQFTASFVAPNKFRHEIKEDVLLGSTGQKVYSYKTEESAYTLADAPKDRATATKDLPQDVAALLELQNPSLMLSLSKDPVAELTENVSEISKLDDTKIGDAAFPTIKLALSDKSSLTLAIEPDTHLIRRATADLTAGLKERRADLTSALVTVDYSKIAPDAEAKEDQFAWAPPAGAKNASAMAQAHPLEGTPASALEGKPAPAFKLESPGGKKIALADLKGKVVVLDFWATWCGPCRMSLPHLDKLYKEDKENGVEFFAVNQREQKDEVEQFVKQTNLTVPVLLDSDGKVGDSYGVEGIPTTVVIGKNGKVQKVFVGFGEDSENQLKTAIQQAMK